VTFIPPRENPRMHMHQRKNSKLYKCLNHHSYKSTTKVLSLSKTRTKLDLIGLKVKEASKLKYPKSKTKKKLLLWVFNP